MNNTELEALRGILSQHGTEPWNLMDIMRHVQREYGWVAPEVISTVSRELGMARVEVESFVSFYSFLSTRPRGRIVIRLCDDVPDRMKGYGRVREAFQQALGIQVGETTRDGAISLETTACIGLSDQAPAALVGMVPVTELSSDKAWEVVRQLRSHGDPERLVRKLGDGNNAHPRVRAMVKNNLQTEEGLIFSEEQRGLAIRRALAVSPREVIRAVKTARLRGRGGAGFPTGMKWEFTRSAVGRRRFVICNADEGEPGTFKDRVILTERPDRVFAGMTIAGYAIGAREGILYLRAEYEYLKEFLEAVLEQRRADGLLGQDILGREGFHFDIRIQMGAGAYMCGEETALINSCEGLRGDAKTRPPFPAQKGFLGFPTTVNNVETLCCVTKIMELGPATFAEYGTPESTGTKLLSVSGDCLQPGVYEVPFGIPLGEFLSMCGADEVQAVQVGGPSGRLVGPKDYHRAISFDDLATGGSMMVFGPDRDLLEVVEAFAEFFADESCGYCTPCRVGTTLLVHYLDRLREGRADPADLEAMRQVGLTMKRSSRCGLGQTAANPLLSALESFPRIAKELVRDAEQGDRRAFSLSRAVAQAEKVQGRTSRHAEPAGSIPRGREL